MWMLKILFGQHVCTCQVCTVQPFLVYQKYKDNCKLILQKRGGSKLPTASATFLLIMTQPKSDDLIWANQIEGQKTLNFIPSSTDGRQETIFAYILREKKAKEYYL